MRNVPLYAAGDPGSNQPDERRLDDMLPIDEIVVIGLVDAFEDAAADLGQHADSQILVLEVDHGIGLVYLFAGERIVHGVRIDWALRSLGRAAEEEHGVGPGISGQVGRYGDFLFPYLDGWTAGGRQQGSGIHPDRYGQDRRQRPQDSHMEHSVSPNRI